jgi:hypothetical protein
VPEQSAIAKQPGLAITQSAENRPVNHSTLAAGARRHDMEGEFHRPRPAPGEMEFRCRELRQPTQFAAETMSASSTTRRTKRAAGREDRDVRHQDRKLAFRATASCEGKVGWRHVYESAGDSGKVSEKTAVRS